MVTVSTEEFEAFWSEVLGGDWYVDDGLYDFDPKIDKTVELDDWVIGYQGRAKGAAIETPKYVKRDEFDDPFIHTGLLTLFNRWKAAQTHTVLVASFRVPKNEVKKFTKAIEKLGGKVEIDV